MPDASKRIKSMLKEMYGENKKICCVICREPFSDKNVYSHLGWKETRISQICEKCFDFEFQDDD